MKLRTLAIGVALSFTSLHASAVDPKEIFDTYAQGAAGEYKTSGRTFWYGGSFQGRIKPKSADLLTLEMPSVSAGCRGIDAFAGSFSLISGDELVQVARGIAQGAPMYFFQLALDSMCPGCGKAADSLRNELMRLNKFTKNSCQTASSLAQSAFTSLTGKVEGERSSDGIVAETLNGFATDFGGALNKVFDEEDKVGLSETVAKEIVAGNIIYEQLKANYGQLEFGALGLDTRESREFVISLIGTKIMSYESSGKSKKINVDTVMPTLSYETIIYGASNDDNVPTNEKVFLNSCNDDDCLKMSTSTYGGDGLVKLFESALLGDDNNVLGGILGKFKARVNLTPQESAINNIVRAPFLAIAQSDNANLQRELLEYFARTAALGFVISLDTSIQDITNSFKVADVNSDSTGRKVQMIDEIREMGKVASESLQKELKKLQKEIDDRAENIKTLEAAKELLMAKVKV